MPANQNRYRFPDHVHSNGQPASYRQARPMMAHPVRLEPAPAKRRRIAPDLLVIAVILAVVLAASLVRVSL